MMTALHFLRSPGRVPALAVAAALLLYAPSGAQAGFAFTQSNFTNNTVSSPFATVDITGDTSTGRVTFTIDVGSNPAKFGAFGFNTSVSTSHFSLLSLSGTGGSTSLWSLSGGGQMDGFGSFVEQVAPSNNGAANRLSTLTFTLQFTAGNFSEATAANFEVANSPNGNFFALEYFPNTGSTGFVAVNSLTPVPEPASFALAAIGFVALGMTRVLRRCRG